MRKGDVLHYITWGGGGWGDPLDRPTAHVLRDVMRGLVTVEGALKNYGVVVKPDGVSVDEETSVKTRTQAKAKRGEAPLFNFGFRTGLKATPEELQLLLKQCELDTGLKAPRLPGQEVDEHHCCSN